MPRRNAKPKTKPYKIADGEGLFLLIMPSGSKYWRLKYFFAGKEKLLALGVYPEITLADARDGVRRHVRCSPPEAILERQKKRPSGWRSSRAPIAFEVVAREWFEKRKHEWAPHSAVTMLARLEQHILPKLGQRPIADITAPEVLAMLRVVEGQRNAGDRQARDADVRANLHVCHRHRTGRTKSGSRFTRRIENSGRQTLFLPESN